MRSYNSNRSSERDVTMANVNVAIHFEAQHYDLISCYRKPVEQTDEIKGWVISLVRSTGFPQQLNRSWDRVSKGIGPFTDSSPEWDMKSPPLDPNPPPQPQER